MSFPYPTNETTSELWQLADRVRSFDIAWWADREPGFVALYAWLDLADQRMRHRALASLVLESSLPGRPLHDEFGELLHEYQLAAVAMAAPYVSPGDVGQVAARARRGVAVWQGLMFVESLLGVTWSAAAMTAVIADTVGAVAPTELGFDEIHALVALSQEDMFIASSQLALVNRVSLALTQGYDCPVSFSQLAQLTSTDEQSVRDAFGSFDEFLAAVVSVGARNATMIDGQYTSAMEFLRRSCDYHQIVFARQRGLVALRLLTCAGAMVEGSQTRHEFQAAFLAYHLRLCLRLTDLQDEGRLVADASVSVEALRFQALRLGLAVQDAYSPGSLDVGAELRHCLESIFTAPAAMSDDT